LLLWLGLVGYALYNYAFYLFGAALNAFFPIYAAALVVAAIVLIFVLSHTDPGQVAGSFRPTAPVRLIGVFVGMGLSGVWTAMWAGYVFAGRPTPVEPEVFKLVAALDLSLMVPALTIGGLLIWKQKPWGVVARQHPGGALSIRSVGQLPRGLLPWCYNLPWRVRNLGTANHLHDRRGAAHPGEHSI
jgi:hypothetical protein